MTGIKTHLLYPSLCWIALVTITDSAVQMVGEVPDEQRLYTDLMEMYEPAVRPVLNASKTIIVNFKMSLNQIVDLDERKQVLTTNVFINQEWGDENLAWSPEDYNGIRTLRVPAAYVWLPDTFIFNNADDGSTGFMQGVYVLLNSSGTVLWPVPVKLRSSCKVDIMYFPFDDQQCILRFGSWIHSGEWMDFESSLEAVDLTNYIDNSEWELLSIEFEKGVHTYACCPDPHPDLTYTLHIRRRTFFYVFNIIVPCVMLSVLTLLTFWLPTTSGEKISLGLSVFLAFSMFMLLIAEEVPATSESVPLIGIYLTTVMTMTSVSVIMAVMVINIYNKSNKARRPPQWLKVVVLRWIPRLLRMSHDMARLANSLKLNDDEEEKYICPHHHLDIHTTDCLCRYEQIVQNIESGRPPGMIYRSDSDVEELSRRFTNLKPEASPSSEPPDYEDCAQNGFHSSAGASNERPNRKESLIAAMASPIMAPLPTEDEDEEEEEVVWLRREEVNQEPLLKKSKSSLSQSSRPRRIAKQHYRNQSFDEILPADDHHGETIAVTSCDTNMPRRGILKHGGKKLKSQAKTKADQFARVVAKSCRREKSLALRKEIVVEWQTIATVIDRLLFWIFLLATIIAYLAILVFVPMTKPDFPKDMPAMHAFARNSPHS